ncbi:MAG: RsmE family RNA methyltransferase, partial [Comamonadaceae bacterium]
RASQSARLRTGWSSGTRLRPHCSHAASVQPLMTAHGVLRLSGERADKKVAHWQAVAVAACEQCGRNRVPELHPVRSLADWLALLPSDPEGELRALASLAEGASPAGALAARPWNLARVLSGPEGGLSPQEEALAQRSGFISLTLGSRVLRAETAALAATLLLSG